MLMERLRFASLTPLAQLVTLEERLAQLWLVEAHPLFALVDLLADLVHVQTLHSSHRLNRLPTFPTRDVPSKVL